MPLSDSDLKGMILEEMGQFNNPFLALTIETVLWPLYEEKSFIAPRLQYLYVKRHAMDWLRSQHNPSPGQQATLEEDPQVTLRAKLRNEAHDEIEKVERKSAASRLAVVGQSNVTSPLENERHEGNPNDRYYRGDPLRRWPRR